MGHLNTYHIHINGIVQGVGFRPMIYQLAKKSGLHGYVKNGNDGLHVFFNAAENIAGFFFNEIKKQAPLQAKIISSELSVINPLNFDSFSIITEDDKISKNVLICPDKALCNECSNELHDKNNRRYRYPFTSCTQCGPRYSILNRLPYERQETSLKDFPMCESCRAEYANVTDRRFFSQTISCVDEHCGIRLTIKNSKEFYLPFSSENILLKIKEFFSEGKIIAVKGIGGYLLLCDAGNAATIQLLRRRKNRPKKPFAVLYPSVGQVEKEFSLHDKEKELFQSSERPIVLISNGKGIKTISIDNIAPGLDRTGIMLPYTPLLDLIAKDYDKPLIATSGNVSGSPVIYKDKDAESFLLDVADYVVSYNCEIVLPQDDSVLLLSKYSHQQIMLRRSRGYAPCFLNYSPATNTALLATGAFLKSSFTLSVNGNVFISQFLGSGECYESQQMYKDSLTHWINLYNTRPAAILTDLHPGYFSHQYAIELAEEYKADIKFIQHHEAHFAAVLAENHLLQTAEPVMGVIWDGTGLGRDGNLWGGEFFRYEKKEIQRSYHFDYFPVIAGDKLAREPRIAALCTTNETRTQPPSLKEKFTTTAWNNYQLLLNTTTVFSSSVGRIFDAVACVLDLCDQQTYEGEAAMQLQRLAEEYVDEYGFDVDESYFNDTFYDDGIPTFLLMQGILMDIKNLKDKKYIAAKFHYSLVCLIDIIARNLGVEKICFSGGVFQNALLVDWIQQNHKNKYELYFHKELSPNDENISFGQMVYYDNNFKTITGMACLKTEAMTQYS